MAWFGTTQAGAKAKLARRSKSRANREKGAARVEGEDVSLDAIYDRDNAKCSVCKRHVVREQASLEHVVPLSAGGAHTEENLRLAHRTCNSKKGARQAPRRKGLRRTAFKPKARPKPPTHTPEGEEIF
jgi:5-methylcytosine-specific restriction endonuclease McrA